MIPREEIKIGAIISKNHGASRGNWRIAAIYNAGWAAKKGIEHLMVHFEKPLGGGNKSGQADAAVNWLCDPQCRWILVQSADAAKLVSDAAQAVEEIDPDELERSAKNGKL